MKRIVVFGQTGPAGRLSCEHFADRLAQRLGLARLGDRDPEPVGGDGWVAVEPVGEFSETLFRAADTAIWLQYSPAAVVREWLADLRARFSGGRGVTAGAAPTLADLRDSVLHLALTPHVHRSLRHPALAHLHVMHLRNPDEADFWLRTQELRMPIGSSMQPA